MGETTRYFGTRVQEHLHKSSGASNIFSHLQQNPECREKCDENCFKIIDCARTKFTEFTEIILMVNFFFQKKILSALLGVCCRGMLVA